MKNKIVLCLFSMILSLTCYAQNTISKLPVGKWIVVEEQTSYLKNGKVLKAFPVDKIEKEDAYIYNFSNAKTVHVSNFNNEFDWKFNVKVNKNQLDLSNIHGDAEDDCLKYSYNGELLVLKRVMEDSDPDDDSIIIDVVTTMTLRKL